MNPGIFALPDAIKTEQWFYAQGSPGAISSTKNWQQWTKPQNCQFVAIRVLGAGSGGGNGFSGAASSARGGGGGGAGGGICFAIFPASLLPNVLWVQVSRGGTAGNGGGRTLVSAVRDIAVANLIIISGAGDVTAGGNGTASAAGSGGSGGSATAIGTCGFIGSAITFNAIGGASGSAGGAHTGAVGVSHNRAFLHVSGGAGGAGTTSANFSGGAMNAFGNGMFSQPSLSGSSGGGITAQSGYNMFAGYLINSGGTGGGSSDASVGSNGGDGGLGSGGGGGGAGTTGGTGGTGGDGLAIIATW